MNSSWKGKNYACRFGLDESGKVHLGKLLKIVEKRHDSTALFRNGETIHKTELMFFRSQKHWLETRAKLSGKNRQKYTSDFYNFQDKFLNVSLNREIKDIQEGWEDLMPIEFYMEWYREHCDLWTSLHRKMIEKFWKIAYDLDKAQKA